jgi:hypothetical protein
MKKVLALVAIVMLVAGFSAVEASAFSFDFNGSFEVRDDDSDGFAEILNFNHSIFGKSLITSIDPGVDAVLDAGSYVMLSEFELDSTSTNPYNFLNNPYVDGFEVYDSNDNLLLQADITLMPLSVDGGTGIINPSFGLSLTDIEVLVGGSPVIDAFGAPGVAGGAVDFTLNIASDNLAEWIENGGGQGSYSGSAAPAPVPEPGTVLLLGAGLMGLIGLGRKRINK